MLGLPLAFTVPAVLGALVLLPALWFLLRVTPPRPRRQSFPPLRLILDQQPKDETPARTPPWLLILRLAIAAAIVLAMAGPIWNPLPPGLGGAGPLALLIDDGFAAAPDWDTRVAAAAERLGEAGRAGRPAALAALSEGPRALVPGTAAAALDRLRALKPSPFLVDRAAALPALRDFAAAHPDADLVWIADGLENGGARAFADAVSHLGLARPATVLAGAATPLALAGAENRPDALAVTVLRADTRATAAGTLRASDIKGLAMGDVPFAFAGDATQTTASFTLPVELRNDVARVDVLGESSAGAVTLLDGRWKRRRVDIVSGATADVAQPLLSPGYFVAKALAPFADLRELPSNAADPVGAALDDHPSVLVMADIGQVVGADHDRLARFVDEGGVLLRFAGSRLAGAPADDLEPRQPAPRRPHLRGRPVVGQAQGAGALRPVEPLLRPAGPARRDGVAPGPGRARRRPAGPHLGGARRRHAARHRGPARQGRHRAVPRHRRHHLVEPAAVRPLRRHAAPHRGARRRRGRGWDDDRRV